MNNDKNLPLCDERLNSEWSAGDSPIWSGKACGLHNPVEQYAEVTMEMISHTW